MQRSDAQIGLARRRSTWPGVPVQDGTATVDDAQQSGRRRAEVGSTQRYEEEIESRVGRIRSSTNKFQCAVPEKQRMRRVFRNEAVADGD